MILKDRESIREFLKENGIRDLVGLQQVIKQMTGVLIEEILEAERDEFLGYQRYQRKDEKRVRSSFGEIELKIPRDRKGEFEPKLIGKYQKDISQIEDSIVFLENPFRYHESPVGCSTACYGELHLTQEEPNGEFRADAKHLHRLK